MSNDSKIFDRAVGHHQPMLGAEIAHLDRGAINYLPDIRPIVRMSSIDHHLYCRLCRKLVFKYSISFIGPVDFPARDVPAETPVWLSCSAAARYISLRRSASSALLRSARSRASRSARCTDGTSRDKRVFRT